MTVNLVNAYTEYWIERAKFKAKQRQELDKHMHDKAVVLGGAISEARAQGNRVEDIMVIVGRKNKTFIYEMLDIFNASRQPELEAEPKTPEPEEYKWWLQGNNFFVSIPGEPLYTVTHIQGQKLSYELPDEWIEGSDEQRYRYRRIINEIRDYDATRQK